MREADHLSNFELMGHQSTSLRLDKPDRAQLFPCLAGSVTSIPGSLALRLESGIVCLLLDRRAPFLRRLIRCMGFPHGGKLGFFRKALRLAVGQAALACCTYCGSSQSPFGNGRVVGSGPLAELRHHGLPRALGGLEALAEIFLLHVTCQSCGRCMACPISVIGHA